MAGIAQADASDGGIDSLVKLEEFFGRFAFVAATAQVKETVALGDFKTFGSQRGEKPSIVDLPHHKGLVVLPLGGCLSILSR